MRFSLALTVLGVATFYLSPFAKQLAAEPPATVKQNQENAAVPNGDPQEEKEDGSWFNLATKTGGGTQLWTDHLYRDGYRIQQNALTGHWRLLDPSDIRRAWGTRAQCTAALDEVHPRGEADPKGKHVTVLLHGLMRTHHSMKPLGSKLREAGYENIVRFSYASTRSSIGDHASALRELVEDMPSNTTFSFIGHSMGNIVVRHLIGDLQNDGDPRRVLERCQSMVMLGPPNQGAAIARRLAPSGLYGLITGKGGMQLGPEWNEFVLHLATPPFPFAVVAGDLSKNRVQNPLVDGSSDFVVSVKEAELDGAERFETVAVLHSFLMNDNAVQRLTVDFLTSH